MSFQIQNQIKKNAQEIRTYMSDLNSWSEEMSIKQKAKIKFLKQERAKQQQIKKHQEKQVENQKKENQEEIQQKNDKQNKKPNLIRDSNTIKDYYQAWDNLNVDAELKKLEEEERKAYKPYNPYENSQNYIRAKPKAKVNINVNRQRLAVTDPTELKDKGNIHFKVCEYEKAIEAYSQCLQKLNNQQLNEKISKLKSVVYSNRAMSFMKLNENSKALRDCIQSIKYDPGYIKSYLRRGECHKKLGNYLQSLADYKKVKELDANDKSVDIQIKKLQKYLQKLYKQARESLVMPPPERQNLKSYRIPIQQIDDLLDIRSKTSNYHQENKINFLEEL